MLSNAGEDEDLEMADTVPTATTLQPKSPSKKVLHNDGFVENYKQKQKKAKTFHENAKELNGVKQVADNELFIKSAKDKQHDRKSRTGRQGSPKKGDIFVLFSRPFCCLFSKQSYSG